MSDFARSVTVDIADASPATLTMNFARLTGGQWEETPKPGSTIAPGGEVTYVNGVESNYDPLGGQVVLTPASGGMITIRWDWTFGSGVSGGVTTDSLSGLAVSYQWINTQSNNPTLQLTVSADTAAELLRASAKA
jgi:hypothetical protein